MVFSSSHVCENWTIKKAEHRRIDGFELRCWRRLLRVPWTARRSNQSILKEISPEYSLEGLIATETSILWPPDAKKKKGAWCWERLKGGGEGDDRGWDGWMASPTQWTWVWVMDSKAWRVAVHGVSEWDTTERLNWTAFRGLYLSFSLLPSLSEMGSERNKLGV